METLKHCNWCQRDLLGTSYLCSVGHSRLPRAWNNGGVIGKNSRSFFFFFYLGLCWVFTVVRELSVVAESRATVWLQCVGFSLRRLLSLWSTAFRVCRLQELWLPGSVVVAHGLNYPKECRIFFLEQRSNLCPLHRPADS